jgi:dsDNA-specific endonuclease/ATPase MutS2
MHPVLPKLTEAIVRAISELEAAGDIVVTIPAVALADQISEAVREVFTGSLLSPSEILSVVVLLTEAAADRRFYDSEMPTKVGLTATEVQELAARLRSVTAL